MIHNITKIDKKELQPLVDGKESITLEYSVNSNLELVLEKSKCHFAGFKPATVITVYHLEKVDDCEWHVLNSEYFPATDTSTALDAMAERLKNGSISGQGLELSDFLKEA